MTFLPAQGNEKKINLDLISTGFNKEMDVIHHFIKNIFFKKARFLRIEIFESPPHAILTLAKNEGQSTPFNVGEKIAPTHIVKLLVSKDSGADDNYKVALDIKALPIQKSGIKTWIWQKLKVAQTHIQTVSAL